MSHERTGSEASSFGSQSKHLAALAPRARGEGGGGARTHLTPDFPSQAGGRNGLPPAKGKMGVFGCGRTVRLTRGGALLFAGGFDVPGGGGRASAVSVVTTASWACGGVSSGMQCRLGAGE